MLRLSASDLESFRYWRDGDGPLSELLARLRHEEPPTEQMLAGRAFAKLLEHVGDGDVDRRESEDFTFDFGQVDVDLAWPAHREIKAEMVIDTPSGSVTLVGVADALDGLTVHDAKLTERWDAEKYLDSLQWRVYALMFGATTFVYDVFLASYKGRHVTIRDYHRMAFYAYPTLRADVEKAVRELAAVVKEYLPERVTPDAQSIEEETTT